MKPLIVLVRTRNPGNLGGCARAAKNFGASLALISPVARRDHPDALAYASGAEDVLGGSPVLADLAALSEEADLVVALSSLRGRAARGLPPRFGWPALRGQAAGRRLALVFGPERGGLTTEELQLCDGHACLPADSSFPTLNLSQAVAAVLALLASGRPAARLDAGATSRELARLLGAFRQTLALAGYPGRGHSSAVMVELESFLKRARPNQREVSLLLGAFAALGRRLRRRATATPSPCKR